MVTQTTLVQAIKDIVVLFETAYPNYEVEKVGCEVIGFNEVDLTVLAKARTPEVEATFRVLI